MLRAILYRILFFVVVYSLLLAYVARADFMDLQEVSIDYKNFQLRNANSRNPLIFPESPKEGLDFTANTDFFWGLVYVNATVDSLTTSQQFREVGLETRLGFHLGDHVNLGIYHHSQHVLDEEQPVFPRFPEEDAFELKVYLYRR